MTRSAGPKIRAVNRGRWAIAASFLLVWLILGAFRIPVPREVPVLLALWPLLATFVGRLAARARSLRVSLRWQTGAWVLDVALLTAIHYFLGGGWWMGAAFYGVLAALVNLSLPRAHALVITAITATAFPLLLFAGVVGLVTPHPFVGSPEVAGNYPFAFTTGLSGIAVIVLLTVLVQAIRERLAQRKMALLESERRYRSLFELNPSAIFAVASDRRLTTVNPGLERLTGYPADELQGLDFGVLVSPESRSEAERVFASVIEGATEQFEIEVVHREGKRVHTRGVVVPTREQGVVTGVFGFAEDVTETRMLEAQLRTSQKMEAIGRLAGGIAHDFNNIMTVISAGAALVREAVEDEEIREEVRELERAAERAAALTRQLLAFSRKQLLQPMVLDPNEIVRGMEHMLQRLMPKVRITCELENGTPPILVDPNQLEQVLMNLAVNGRDAMDHEGTLTISTGVRHVGEDEAQLRPELPSGDGEFVVMAVKDTGAGIPEEIQPQIFEPFFTTKVQGQGTGLGLATVYGIVKQSGGYVYLDSAMGRGTTFELYFPAVEGPVTSVRPPARAPPSLPRIRRAPGPSLSEGRILLVEDETDVRVVAERILERAGYRVMGAASAEEAIELLEDGQQEIELLVTDVMLQDRTGPQLAEWLVGRRPGIPVLYTSGYTEDEVFRQGMIEGNVGFLEKPFSPAELIEKVEAILNAGGEARPSLPV